MEDQGAIAGKSLLEGMVKYIKGGETMKVLNFGSLNIDYVYSVDHICRKGETISSNALNIYSGGKGLNQSVALGKAGIHPYHAGKIGNEGIFLLDVLRKADVDVGNVKISNKASTGNAIIQNEADGDNCIILYGGANRDITLEDIEEVLMKFGEGDILVCQNEISQVEELIHKAHEKGMSVFLNPSPMDEVMINLDFKEVDYIILNEIEAGQLTELNTEDGDMLIDALQKRFPGIRIVLTLGSKGSIYADSEKKVRHPIFPVHAVDTTAAGDTFLGYFIANIAMKKTPEEALRIASMASAIAVTKSGAAPSIPAKEQVMDELVKKT